MNKELLSKVYETYSNSLYLYIYSFCHNQAQAEDILQDVFLKALLSLKDSHTNFKAWLYLVAKHCCINANQAKVPLPLNEEITIATNENILNSILAKENRQKLYQAILSLPQMQRQAILLQYFAGLSQQEIGATLGVSTGNVKVIIHRGKKELKKLLEVQEHGL